jgi:hypothetical protein
VAERGLTPAMLVAIAAGTVRPALFSEITYWSGSADAYLRMWTGVGSLSWNGYTWTGGGEQLAITVVKETRDIVATGFSIVLSGMPSASISIALQSMRKHKPGKLWLGCFDAAGALIEDPYLLRRGRFDIIPIKRDGATCTIEARYNDRLVLLERAGGPLGESRYTDEDQQRFSLGDGGFRHTARLQDKTFEWGA